LRQTTTITACGPAPVEAAGPGELEGDQVHPDQLGQRVGAARPGQAAGRRDVVEQPLGSGPEQPHDAAGVGHGDRAVPELHRGIGLGPHGRRLAQLERRLVGQAVGPAGAEEGELAGGQQFPGDGLGEHALRRGGGRGDVVPEVRAEQGELGGGKPGLDHGLFVGEGEFDDLVGGEAHRGPRVRGDSEGGSGTANSFS
jgi:hypothetical protein